MSEKVCGKIKPCVQASRPRALMHKAEAVTSVRLFRSFSVCIVTRSGFLSSRLQLAIVFRLERDGVWSLDFKVAILHIPFLCRFIIFLVSEIRVFQVVCSALVCFRYLYQTIISKRSCHCDLCFCTPCKMFSVSFRTRLHLVSKKTCLFISSQPLYQATETYCTEILHCISETFCFYSRRHFYRRFIVHVCPNTISTPVEHPGNREQKQTAKSKCDRQEY
jgi:hypothetical protein